MNPFLKHRRIKNICWIRSKLWDPKLWTKGTKKR